MAEYGDAAKALWPLEPEMIFLNHGSYGATPHEVLAEQIRWRDRLEAQPCRFVNVEAPAEMRRVADLLGAFVGAQGKDIALVENTTNGINAIVKSLQFESDDEIVVADHIYNAVRNTLRFVLDPVGAKMVVVPIGLPLRDPEPIADRLQALETGEGVGQRSDFSGRQNCRARPSDGSSSLGRRRARAWNVGPQCARAWRRLVRRQLPQVALRAKRGGLSLGSAPAPTRPASQRHLA